MALIEQQALNIGDLRQLARARLPRGICEFIERGSEDDAATRNNRAAYDRYVFWPQVLKDVSKRHVRTAPFGQSMSLPIAMAPTGAAGLGRHLLWSDSVSGFAAQVAATLPALRAVGAPVPVLS